MQLITLNPKRQFHCKLSYKLLQERYTSDNINLRDESCPTYKQHCHNLRHNYKVIVFGKKDDTNEIIGLFYIDNNNYIGVFIFRKYQTILNSYGYFFLKECLDKYKPQHEPLYALIHINNKQSRKLADLFGFKQTGIHYTLE